MASQNEIEINENTLLVDPNTLQDAINEVFGEANTLTQIYDADITHLFSPIPSPILRRWKEEDIARHALIESTTNYFNLNPPAASITARQPITLGTSYTEIFPSAPPAPKRRFVEMNSDDEGWLYDAAAEVETLNDVNWEDDGNWIQHAVVPRNPPVLDDVWLATALAESLPAVERNEPCIVRVGRSVRGKTLPRQTDHISSG